MKHLLISAQTASLAAPSHRQQFALTDDQQIVVGELVVRHLQIQRSRTLADATGRIVMGAVARAVVAAELAGIRDRYAAQMRADANHHQPLGLLDALLQNHQEKNTPFRIVRLRCVDVVNLQHPAAGRAAH